MFDLRNLFGALPPAIVEHQILFVGLAASWLFVAHYKGQTRKVREIMLTRRSINTNWTVNLKPFSSRISRRLCLNCRLSPTSEP